MRRNFSLFVTMAVVSLLIVGCGLGPVAAQENASDELEDAADEIGDETRADTLEHQEELRFDNQTRLVAWEFDGGEFVGAIDTDRTAWVTISDNVAGVGEEGAVHVPETSHQLERAETTIVTMPVESFNGGHSVTASVSGESIRLSTEMDDEGENPLQYFGGEQGLFTGMILSVAMSGGATWFVLWREETGVIKA